MTSAVSAMLSKAICNKHCLNCVRETPFHGRRYFLQVGNRTMKEKEEGEDGEEGGGGGGGGEKRRGE
jgi:hypothetical protein